MAGLRKRLSRIRRLGFGFQMKEIMEGEHRFHGGYGPPGVHPLSFSVTWGTPNLGHWLDPQRDTYLTHDLEGEVSVAGLGAHLPCRGHLELRYFGEHLIRYSFDFEADGVEYSYVGEKVNIQLWNLPVAHTTCFGWITEKTSGRLVSTSVTHFRMKTLPGFVSSIRLL